MTIEHKGRLILEPTRLPSDILDPKDGFRSPQGSVKLIGITLVPDQKNPHADYVILKSNDNTGFTVASIYGPTINIHGPCQENGIKWYPTRTKVR